MSRWLAAAATAAVLAVSVGCANKPPSIARVYARVMYQHDVVSGAKSEGLSVFLVASDPDGVENLSAFYVINDDAELFWKVDSSSWVSSTAEGETWIGSNTLAMPGSASLPAGKYRVLLENDGGDTAEETFTIPSREISAADAGYPAATVANGAITVSGPYDAVDVWAYGRDGKFIADFPARRKNAALEVQKMIAASPTLAQGFTFRVFANNARGGFGVVTGPYTVAPQPLAPMPAAPPGPAAPSTLPPR